MAIVETIFVRLRTGTRFSDSGFDGDVYIGLGGREFEIDSHRNDFERGDDRTYILGKEPSVPPQPNPEYIGLGPTAFGSPSHPYRVKTENLNKFPVYVRIVKKDNTWDLDYVEVRANPETDNLTYTALEDDAEWLPMGVNTAFLYLLPKPAG